MVWAAPALRFPVALMQAALATFLFGAVLTATEPYADLGVLVCTMEPGTITALHPSILEHLKLCPMLMGTQRDAVNAVLLRGSTAYGHPSGWDLETLQRLGPLALALNQTTLSLVDKAAREAFARSIAATYSTQGWEQREQSLTLLTAMAAVSHPRPKRSADQEMPAPDAPSPPAAGCKQEPITARVLSESILLFDYDSPEQFYLCLSDNVLQTDLERVLEQPLTTEYLWVLKKRLQEVYPTGMPDAQLRRLGPLSRLYTVQELSQWQVTSADTLCTLLNPSDGKWSSAQKQQLIARFLELGGNLTGPLLQQIGGIFLCNLNEEQIEKILPEAIGSAGELDISSCSQNKKDQFYSKAQQAFASQAGTKLYYLQMRPYLGGAPAEDLKDLAENGVDMDIDTFLALNPNELQKLSVLDVKNLLGANIQQLKGAENQTAVMCWVKKQSQQELDQILGIGLQGGMQEPPPKTTPHPLTAAPTPIATSSHPTNPNTSPEAPTPNAASPTFPYTAQPSTAVTSITSTPAPSSITPCFIHQPTTSKPPATTLLTTILTAVSPRATSPSSVPPPAVTHGATTSTDVPNPTGTIRSTGTPLVSPALGGTTGPAPAPCNTTTPSSPCALVPKPTSVPAATTATEMNPLTHKPTTPLPNITASTQSISSSTSKTTAIICKTGVPPASLGPSSTTSSREITKKGPVDVPETPRPPPGGYINLQPQPGSGSRVSSCLLHILTTAMGISLLQGLL